MNDRTLVQHYDQFTPEERMRLTLAALAREDETELARLETSAPRMNLVGSDPKYSQLLDSVWDIVVAVVSGSLNVSHYLVRARLEARLYRDMAVQAEMRLRDAAQTAKNRGELEAIVDRFRASEADAKRRWDGWSAAWQGIESAITRFCVEVGLPRDHVFAMAKSLPPVIAEARGLVTDVSVNRDFEAEVYGKLRDAWPGRERSKPAHDLQSPGGVAPTADSDTTTRAKRRSGPNSGQLLGGSNDGG